MPEPMEDETERVHEIVKELEEQGGSLIRQIALTTALFAAIAAIASLFAGASVNEALVLKTEAARLQAEASDQWTYYQAKGIKAAVQEASRTSWIAIGKEPPPQYGNSQQQYRTDQSEIEKKARELERQRDEKSIEADHLLHQHHHYAYAVAILQVAIALGAIAALTRYRMLWFGSLLGGVGATVIFIYAMLAK